MKRLFSILLFAFAALAVQAQDVNSIDIDPKTFRPIQSDALTGVGIDPIGQDDSRRPCARIKMKINRMTKEDIAKLDVILRTNNQKTKVKPSDYENGLIIEMTAKPETRFYLQHDIFGQSNEVTLNLEGNKEYYIEAYLNHRYSITIASNVAGASVYIDDSFVGETNKDYVCIAQNVLPGPHTIKIEHGGLAKTQNINVQADKVYFKQEIDAITASPKFVIFNVFPSNATIEIDGKIKTPEEFNGELGIVKFYLNQGNYQYTITAPEHHSITKQLTVSEKVVLEERLMPSYGYLNIVGDSVNGANVSIGSDVIGTAPIYNHKLSSKEYSVKIIKPHYKPFVQNVVIEDSKTTEIAPVLEPNFAKVLFKASPDTEIYVNDKLIGRGEVEKEYDVDIYKVEGRRVGHKTSEQTLNIESTATKIFNVADPTPIYGSIVVDSKPSSAKVRIDDVLIPNKETPDQIDNIIIGRHKVTLEHPDCKPYTTEVTVIEGQTVNIDAELTYIEGKRPTTTVSPSTTPTVSTPKSATPKSSAPKQPKSPAPKPVKPTTAKPVATKPAAVKPSTTKQPQSSSTGIGYQSNVMFGAQFGLGYEGTSNCGVSYVGGLRAGNFFFVGLGVGANVRLGQSVNEVTIDTYERQRLSSSLITVPAFLNVRIYMSKGGCKPYLSCYGGAAFGQKRDITIYSGDININYIPHNTTEYFAEPGFGLNFKMKGKSSFNIEFGLPITTRHFFEVISGGQSNSSISVTVPGGNTTTRSSSTSSSAKQGTIYQKGGFALSTRIGFTF